jgi:hypothetical protein
LPNYCYANLHELPIKSVLSYLILSYFIISCGIRFFCLHHGCRFVCARIKHFLSLAFYPYSIFQCLSPKKPKRLRACLVHLSLLVRLVCLPRVARQIKVNSQGSACFRCCCSPCSSIQ